MFILIVLFATSRLATFTFFLVFHQSMNWGLLSFGAVCIIIAAVVAELTK